MSALDNRVTAEVGILYAQIGQMADGEAEIFREGTQPSPHCSGGSLRCMGARGGWSVPHGSVQGGAETTTGFSDRQIS